MNASALAAFAFACAFAVSCGAAAQTVHRCIEDGKVTVTNIPCHGAATAVVTPPDAPAAPDKAAQADLKRMRKEAAVLETARHRREAVDERDAERTNRANAARRQKCDKLKLDKKWADEEVKTSQPQYEERARLKAKRAAEKLAAGCPA